MVEKLTDKQSQKIVDTILSSYEEGESIGTIAKELNLDSKIIKGIVDKHLNYKLEHLPKPMINIKGKYFFLIIFLFLSVSYIVLRLNHNDFVSFQIKDLLVLFILALVLFTQYKLAPLFLKSVYRKNSIGIIDIVYRSIGPFLICVIATIIHCVLKVLEYMEYEIKEVYINFSYFFLTISLFITIILIFSRILNFKFEKVKIFLFKDMLITYANNSYDLDFISKKLDIRKSSLKTFFKKNINYAAYIENVYKKISELTDKLEHDEHFDTSYVRQKKFDSLVNTNFIKKLISNHENRKTEFKQTFFTDAYTNNPNVEREHDVIKAIAGFLNTTGGFILIGVTDNKEVVGIANDKFNNNEDKYIRDIEKVIKKTLGEIACRYIDIRIPEFSSETISYKNVSYNIKAGTKICVLGIEESKTPIYCKHREYNTKRKSKNPLPMEHSFFYIRNNNETVNLEMHDALKYIRIHFDE